MKPTPSGGSRSEIVVYQTEEQASCKDRLQVRDEGPRKVRRRLKHYNLDAILAVGYRVRSPANDRTATCLTATLKRFQTLNWRSR